MFIGKMLMQPEAHSLAVTWEHNNFLTFAILWHFLMDYCHLLATKNLKSFCDIAVNIFLLASYAHDPLESPKDPLQGSRTPLWKPFT